MSKPAENQDQIAHVTAALASGKDFNCYGCGRKITWPEIEKVDNLGRCLRCQTAFVRGTIVEVLVDGQWVVGRVGGSGTCNYNVQHPAMGRNSYPRIEGGKIRLAPAGTKVPNKKRKTNTNNTCPRCLGKGEITAFSHIHGGTCFRCEGSGKIGKR